MVWNHFNYNAGTLRVRKVRHNGNMDVVVFRLVGHWRRRSLATVHTLRPLLASDLDEPSQSHFLTFTQLLQWTAVRRWPRITRERVEVWMAEWDIFVLLN